MFETASFEGGPRFDSVDDLFPLCAGANPLFCDGFETGTTAAWTCSTDNGCTPVPIELFPPLFTGKRKDLETGLLYFEARYLDPRIGRFTQPDPGMLKTGVRN